MLQRYYLVSPSLKIVWRIRRERIKCVASQSNERGRNIYGRYVAAISGFQGLDMCRIITAISNLV